MKSLYGWGPFFAGIVVSAVIGGAIYQQPTAVVAGYVTSAFWCGYVWSRMDWQREKEREDRNDLCKMIDFTENRATYWETRFKELEQFHKQLTQEETK